MTRIEALETALRTKLAAGGVPDPGAELGQVAANLEGGTGSQPPLGAPPQQAPAQPLPPGAAPGEAPPAVPTPAVVAAQQQLAAAQQALAAAQADAPGPGGGSSAA